MLVLLALTIVTGFLLTHRLGSLVPGLSLEEQRYIQAQVSGRQILDNPVFAFHKIPIYILFKLQIHSLGAYRAISGLFAMSMVISSFFILKRWYSLRIATAGSLLLASAAVTLHLGRLATPEATFMLILPLFAVVTWLLATKKRKLSLLILSALIGLSLYVPGFIWLLLGLCAWQRKNLWRAIKKLPWWFRAICGLVIILISLPLIVASSHTPQNVLLAAGLPTHLPSVGHISKNILRIPLQLFILGPKDPVRWLGQLPLLDVFSTVMLVLGVYSLRYHLSKTRPRLLVASIIIITSLVALGGIPLTSLVPLLYVLSAGGIAFMLQQWFTVFPRNPIARAIATSLVSIAVLLVAFYATSHYFIAWPGSPATQQVFNQKL